MSTRLKRRTLRDEIGRLLDTCTTREDRILHLEAAFENRLAEALAAALAREQRLREALERMVEYSDTVVKFSEGYAAPMDERLRAGFIDAVTYQGMALVDARAALAESAPTPAPREPKT